MHQPVARAHLRESILLCYLQQNSKRIHFVPEQRSKSTTRRCQIPKPIETLPQKHPAPTCPNSRITTRRQERQTPSTIPLSHTRPILRPLRTIPIIRRRHRDRLPPLRNPLRRPPHTQQARLSRGLLRQLHHDRRIRQDLLSQLDISAPIDFFKCSFDVRLDQKPLYVFPAREVEPERKRLQLRIMRVIRMVVFLDIVFEVADAGIEQRPLDGNILRKDAGLVERESLTFVCDWGIVTAGGHGSVFFAGLRCLYVPNSVGIGRAIIDDQEVLQEAFEIQLLAHAVVGRAMEVLPILD